MLLAQNPPLWFWSFFPLLAVGVFVAISFTVSLLGGWWRLARSYPRQDATGATRFFFQSGRFGGAINYGSCLTFAVDREYLHIATMLPFRLSHAPLSIPWTDIESREFREMLIFPSVTFTFARTPGVKLSISKRLALKLIRAARDRMAATSLEVPPE
jgi:hypothetical protein